MPKFLTLNDLDAYRVSFRLSNNVWEIILRWDYFSKDTVGKQYIRSVDSISANLAEGFGRYTKKDKIHFYRYALGSVYESLDWTEKARRRDLLSEEQYQMIVHALRSLPKEINGLINYTTNKLAI
ncbi:MAG TPA: four helix bundle protein [Candidatus Peribacteraceae bacterium]|nr:four helix bundle protein [Candidatus Peribacteraceae bacterium]